MILYVYVCTYVPEHNKEQKWKHGRKKRMHVDALSNVKVSSMLFHLENVLSDQSCKLKVTLSMKCFYYIFCNGF